MAESSTNSFEDLWQQACNQPEIKKVEAEKKIQVDLSLDDVLERYTAFVQKAVEENRISKKSYRALLKQTRQYRKALSAAEGGSVLKEIRSLTGRINPFR